VRNYVVHIKEEQRTGYWGKYLDIGKMYWQEAGENSIMMSPIICTPQNIRMIKPRGGVGRACRIWMGNMRKEYKIMVPKPEGKGKLGIRRHRWEYIRVLGWIFGLNSSNWGYGPVAGSREHVNDLSGLIKGGKLLDCLCNYQLPKLHKCY
jgi:hypothetical protein